MESRSAPSSGASEPPWIGQATRKFYPRLEADLEADVAVVGAGVTGLSIAYFLAQEGRRVAVLEDGLVGAGETERSTAHLASALDDRFEQLEALHGAEGAELAWRSHAAAIDEIERIARRHRIPCDFERLPGYLFSGPGQEPKRLDREADAARRAGFPGLRKLARAPFPAFDSGPCLLFPDQAQMNPSKYVAGLAKAVAALGGRIFEHAHVDDHEADGAAVRVKVGARLVRARALAVATNAPIVSRVKLPLRQYAYRTYAVALRVPPDALPRALYWDTAEPYHYVRLQTEEKRRGELLVVGGEDHKTGQPGDAEPDERWARLERWARDRVPAAGETAFRWSGQVLEPVDSLAFIGRYPGAGENVYVATGDSGHGLTHGTIAGLLIRDLVLGRPNAWSELYDPARVTVRSLGEAAAENLDVLPQLGKWVSGGDVASVDEIPRGEGRIVRRGLSKLAVYRDEEGRLHSCSAVCPHLGCLVAWNSGERTWDCPCHGSRFAATGEVLNGPANRGLAPAEPARPEPQVPRHRRR